MAPSPILWNQSRLPKELPGSLNRLVLLLSRQSARFTLPPSLAFVVISSEGKEGLFLPLPVSPPSYPPSPPLQSAFHAGERLSSSSTHKNKPNGLFQPVILSTSSYSVKEYTGFFFVCLFFQIKAKVLRSPSCADCSRAQSETEKLGHVTQERVTSAVSQRARWCV